MKKGFTLIELLGVIAILGLIIVITATSGFGLFDKTKGLIDEIEEENLLEAARTFLVDVDYGLINYNKEPTLGFVGQEITNCNGNNECLKVVYRNMFLNENVVKVDYLEKHGYFNDKKNKCNDNYVLFLKIKTDTDGNVTDYIARKESSSDIICKN